jgi:hypothetical protein
VQGGDAGHLLAVIEQELAEAREHDEARLAVVRGEGCARLLEQLALAAGLTASADDLRVGAEIPAVALERQRALHRRPGLRDVAAGERVLGRVVQQVGAQAGRQIREGRHGKRLRDHVAEGAAIHLVHARGDGVAKLAAQLQRARDVGERLVCRADDRVGAAERVQKSGGQRVGLGLVEALDQREARVEGGLVVLVGRVQDGQRHPQRLGVCWLAARLHADDLARRGLDRPRQISLGLREDRCDLGRGRWRHAGAG